MITIKKKILILMSLLVLIFSLNAFESGKKPFKAAALSLVVPGGGQFYNESYLKAVLVASLECTLIGLTTYHYFKSEDYYNKYRTTGNEKYYDKYLDYYYKRQNDLWWTGLTVFLSVIDAFVDAHLHNFEGKKNDIRIKFEDNALLISYCF